MSKVLTVKFQDSSGRSQYKTYDYTYSGSRNVEKDDLAVVLSPYGGYQVVGVVAVRDKSEHDVSMKAVVEVISFAAERKRKANAERKKLLRKQLKDMAAEHAELTAFETLAASNPEVKKLVEELKTLG